MMKQIEIPQIQYIRQDRGGASQGPSVQTVQNAEKCPRYNCLIERRTFPSRHNDKCLRSKRHTRQIQYPDKKADVTDAVVPSIQTTGIVMVPQVQFIDEIPEVTEIIQKQGPMIQKVENAHKT